jgi:hypothetical protein
MSYAFGESRRPSELGIRAPYEQMPAPPDWPSGHLVNGTYEGLNLGRLHPDARPGSLGCDETLDAASDCPMDGAGPGDPNRPMAGGSGCM